MEGQIERNWRRHWERLQTKEDNSGKNGARHGRKMEVEDFIYELTDGFSVESSEKDKNNVQIVRSTPQKAFKNWQSQSREKNDQMEQRADGKMKRNANCADEMSY